MRSEFGSNYNTVRVIVHNSCFVFVFLFFPLSVCLLHYTGDEEYWLCSSTFTIADIYLSCLLHRLTFVGQSESIFLSKRPITSDYYQRVLKRKSFIQECAYANSLLWSYVMPLARGKFKQACPFILVLSLVAVGTIAYHKRESISEFIEKHLTKSASQNSELWSKFQQADIHYSDTSYDIFMHPLL